MKDIFFNWFCQWAGSAAILGAYYNFVRNPPCGQALAIVGCVLLALYLGYIESWGVFLMEAILGVLAANNLWKLITKT